MKITTLCYMEKDGKYLMLCRNKKKNDENAGKWIGIGGHLERGETPRECIIRECLEETGIEIDPQYRGSVLFFSDACEDECIFVYTAKIGSAKPLECEEGTLAFIEKTKIYDLPLWEGDKVFLNELLTGRRLFSIALTYEGGRLKDSKVYYD